MGTISTIFFHLGTKESLSPRDKESEVPYATLSSDTITSGEAGTNKKIQDVKTHEKLSDSHKGNDEADTVAVEKGNVNIYGAISLPQDAPTGEPTQKKWWHWLKIPQFYQVTSGTWDIFTCL